MEFTIDVDTGGTFTDGFFTQEGQIERVKVDTTPHDFTVCFMKCVEEGARNFGVSIKELLRDTEVVRLSTTIGSNTLITGSGPKLGLLVTKGFENSLYADKGAPNVLFDFILSPDRVIGIAEEMSPSGQSLAPPQEQEVREAVRRLLELGIRVIVVGLQHAGLDDAHEKMVKEMVSNDYPRHFLGAVPILLSTEVSRIQHDALRTNTAVINAYLHKEMARFLQNADDELWKAGYRKPLLVTHAGGGVARVAKTITIQCLDSGPACGVAGTAFMSKLYELEKVVSIDIGGTSTDIGLVVNGVYGFNRSPLQAGAPVFVPSIELESIGGGGGSIAKPILKSKTVQMGPESAGASPGPACYDLGGFEATATDACVVLGYIDPDYFLGGRRKLNREKAWQAVETNVANPLGLGVEETAYMMVKGIESIGANKIESLISERNLDAKDFTLFAFGGAGGIFYHGIATQLGISKIYSFPVSPVFSAFGSSTLDVSHNYESAAKVILHSESSGYLSRLDDFNSIVRQMQNNALRDMRGEGFEPDKVSFSLEVSITGPSGYSIVQSPTILLESKRDVEAICRAYEQEAGGGKGDIAVDFFRLTASAPVPHYQFLFYKSAGKSPEKAYKGERKVYWDGGLQRTSIYEKSLLQCGNIVAGPAIIESVDTAVLVPPGKKYTVDRFLNGVIESV